MIKSVVYLDFSHLDILDEKKQIYINKIMKVVENKFDGTKVSITSNHNVAEQLNGVADVNTVIVHNDPELDCSPEGYGCAFPCENLGEVNINDFNVTDIDDLTMQVGTVSAHEAGHLILPNGHSVESVNLMSGGKATSEILFTDNGESLEFTEIQKSIFNDEINVPDDPTLAELEISYIMDPEEGIHFGDDEFPEDPPEEDIDVDDIIDFLL